MPMNCLETESTINDIIRLNTGLAKFWKESSGWAPESVVHLLSKARLDRMISFSHRLKDFLRDTEKVEHEAKSILLLVNLGALTETSMMLFFSIFYEDYLNDNPYINDKGKVVEPESLSFEQLRQTLIRVKVFEDYHEWVYKIQRLRNSIHSFKHRDIAYEDEFKEHLKKYLGFIREINDTVPYPDDLYQPR